MCILSIFLKKKKEIIPLHESSKPKSTSILEERNKGAIDMTSHDPIHGANKLATNEHNRDNRRTTQKPHQGSLEFLPSRILVKLVHRRVHTHPTEQPLDGMAHAARAYAEYHHCILRSQPLYAFQWVSNKGASWCHVASP